MQVFISHTTHDDKIVEEIRKQLEAQKISAFTDSREILPGDELDPAIKQEIINATTFIAVFSTEALGSDWVQKEVLFALEQEKKSNLRIIPLLLDGLKPTAIKPLFGYREYVAISVDRKPNGVAEIMPRILDGLGLTLPTGEGGMRKAENSPLVELVLELTEPAFNKDHRPTARARLKCIPSTGATEVISDSSFIFTAPIGPIEKDDLRWYLEQYFIWPHGNFRTRAKKTEGQLPEWGEALYKAAVPGDLCGNVLQEWEKDSAGERRFTLVVDSKQIAGTPKERETEGNEAASLLLGLPWELLCKDKQWLFQGKKGLRVRRRLPNRKPRPLLQMEPPIRILLVSPRPEEEGIGYIDHRVSALPLAEALETLGELVELTILVPPTLGELQEELEDAKKQKKPYHVIHFDGHGIYSKQDGLGSLCFEEPEDANKLEDRRAAIVPALELAGILKENRIPLVVLEACQSAQTEKNPTSSVAAALLQEGVSSVIAMTHSVLVETARRFVEVFYRKLAEGERVGSAALAAQRNLHENDYRINVPGAGELRLKDWFVPILFQEQDDPSLFTSLPSELMETLLKVARKTRLGNLPEAPPHAFVGRSRELLSLERLLQQEQYAVITGQGGEGKTTVAVELARWLEKTRRVARVAFVSVEKENENHIRAVIDSLGRQLLPSYSVTDFNEEELFGNALKKIIRVLEEERVLILFDNMESVLPPSPESEAAAWHDPTPLEDILKLCGILGKAEKLRLLFTSREKMPDPFSGGRNRLPLHRLSKKDAVDLVSNVLTKEGKDVRENELGEKKEIEELVEAVNRHARCLKLLAPEIGRLGLGETQTEMAQLMEKMEKEFPGQRELSLYASIELSLRRLSEEIRKNLPFLGLFQGGYHIKVLELTSQLPEEEVLAMTSGLVATGLAEVMEHGHVRLHPALSPYLLRELPTKDLPHLRQQWAEGMVQFASFLYDQLLSGDARIASALTLWELPNLMTALTLFSQGQDHEKTLQYAMNIEQLVVLLGRPKALRRIIAVRESAAEQGDGWSNTQFIAKQRQIERLIDARNLQQAFGLAETLLSRSLQEGESTYAEADYNIAMTYALIGRILRLRGASEKALEALGEAGRRFQSLADGGGKGAAGMASAILTEEGTCFLLLGRFDEAAERYLEGIQRNKKEERFRQMAVGKIQLGTARLKQKRYEEALAAYAEAQETFACLGEPITVAGSWHQTGMVYEEMGSLGKAEEAYGKSLAINVQEKNAAGEASSLLQLGNLNKSMGRLEEAATYYRQATDIYFTLHDLANEGRSQSNLAQTLLQLNRLDEARVAVLRGIECLSPFGHASEPWKIQSILSNIEQAAGNTEAAAEAHRRAIDLFLDYRRDGGENHAGGGRLCHLFQQALTTKAGEEFRPQLAELQSHEEADDSLRALVTALLAFLDGSRDPSLAEDPRLGYRDSAEILFLIERNR